MRRAGSSGTASSAMVRRSQISGVYQVVLTREPGVEGSPNPPKPVFQLASSKPGFSQPVAGVFVVYCQAGSANSAWASATSIRAAATKAARQSRWRRVTIGHLTNAETSTFRTIEGAPRKATRLRRLRRPRGKRGPQQSQSLPARMIRSGRSQRNRRGCGCGCDRKNGYPQVSG